MTVFNPDGGEVSEIILPDGTTASEVVAPDGSVGFDPAPDSAVWQDDFSDGNYDGWDVGTGTWDASNNYLENTSTDNNDHIARTREYAYGYWEFDHRHSPQFYGASAYFVADGSASGTNGPDNGYEIQFQNSNSNYERTLVKIVDGSRTELMSLGEYDSNFHTYRIERTDDGTFTVFVDETEVGTVTDNEIDSSTRVTLRGDSAGHTWDNFDVGTL